jgi:hypothetical protein
MLPVIVAVLAIEVRKALDVGHRAGHKFRAKGVAAQCVLQTLSSAEPNRKDQGTCSGSPCWRIIVAFKRVQGKA